MYGVGGRRIRICSYKHFFSLPFWINSGTAPIKYFAVCTRACGTFFISHYFVLRLINLLKFIFCSMLVSKLGERYRQHLALLFQTSKLTNNSTKGFQILWPLIPYKEEGGFLNTLLLQRVLIQLFLPISVPKWKTSCSKHQLYFKNFQYFGSNSQSPEYLEGWLLS